MPNEKKYVFLVGIESGLSQVVAKELEFLWKNWIVGLRDENNRLAENAEMKISIIQENKPHLIRLELIFTKNENIIDFNSTILFLKEFQTRLFIKNGSIPSYSILLGENDIEELIPKRNRIDYYRLSEEIRFYSSQFLSKNLDYIISDSKTINNISILPIGGHISRKNRKNINDLALKLIKGNDIEKEIGKDIRKDNSKNNGTKNGTNNSIDIGSVADDGGFNSRTKGKFHQAFQIAILEKQVLFLVKITKNLFLNSVFKGDIQRHLTPIAPHIANIMITISIDNLISEMNLKYILDPNQNEQDIDLFIIDPFCGFGTIPMILFSRKDEIYEKFNRIGIILNSIRILGFDNDDNSLKMCIENCKKLNFLDNLDEIYNSVSIDFYNSSIEEMIHDSRLTVDCASKKKVIIGIITQPPYGFTKYVEKKDITEIYEQLLVNTSILGRNNILNLTMITGRDEMTKEIIEKMKSNREFILKIKNSFEFVKKDQKYSILSIKTFEK